MAVNPDCIGIRVRAGEPESKGGRSQIKWTPFVFDMYYLYILQSESTGRYYIGQTDNLERCLLEHNDSCRTGSKTTKRFKGPWKLIYFEEYKTRRETMARERQIKSWKSRKAINRLIWE